MLPRIKTVLYCTEMGPNAAYVFRWAYAIARQFSARIAVLHVIETLTRRQRALVEGYSGQGSLTELIQRAEKEAAARLPERIEQFCAEGAGDQDWKTVISEVIVAEGHPTEEILRQISATRADLVVMGAHAESSVLDRLIGGTARTVVKSSPVPVLTVQIPSGS